jgi:uncharacterized protein (TIGR02271 family)
MRNFANILPGARVRTGEGFIGTVERLEHHGTDGDDHDHDHDHDHEQPNYMVVRSDDGRWRYNIPLMLAQDVAQAAFHPVVQLTIQPEELTHYAAAVDDARRDGRADHAAMGQDEDQPTLIIPVAVEELHAHKEPVVRGYIHIHKGVETVEQYVPVTVYHEEAVVERIPPDQFDGRQPANPNEVIVPIIEERLVVQKRSVVTEYIRIRKTLVPEQQEVRGTVRREVVSVSQRRLEDTAAPDAPPLRDAETQVEADATAAEGQPHTTTSPSGEDPAVAQPEVS